MTPEQRWDILRFLGLARRHKTQLWALLDEVVVDAVLMAKVLEILDRLLAAESDPTTLLSPAQQAATAAADEMGVMIGALKKADTVEFFEGGINDLINMTRDRLLSDLTALIGWEDPDSCPNTGTGYGFS
jgi:hypothetical protein